MPSTFVEGSSGDIPGGVSINISNAFGHLIIQGMDASEKMYESMVLRGFKNKIHYRGE